MESSPKVWTVSALLQWATQDFLSKNFSDARLSAEVLLAHALSTNRVGLYLRHDEPVTEDKRSLFRRSVEERRLGKPVAYITGTKEFYGFPFKVDSRVLIPRPETELLVDEALAYLKSISKEAPRVIDVGTGSGAIAIVLKTRAPACVVTAIDVREEALALARENALALGAEVDFIQSDLLENVSGSFDLIVANLPYIGLSERETLTTEVKDYEPSHALFSGENGTELMERLVVQIQQKGAATRLMLEIGMGQKEAVQRILVAHGFKVISIRNDYSQIPRVVCASFQGLNGPG